ncbi:NAD-dependent protein deacylase [Cohnella laeviribosi]|uniref:NAD-dependent protein deacylase n=1 Tax=Cohnella laeviribosi TaxID=380174 RepID=UPI003D1CB9E5
MNWTELKSIVRNSGNIVFFGGAGTSTESGIPDFRSAGGLYRTGNAEGPSPEEILSRRYFETHTKEFYDFYRTHMIYPDAKPNSAHYALARLEERGQLKAVITQNIDGLHQLAGSRNVLELHGSVHRNFCMKCRAFYPLEYILRTAGQVPLCECGGIVKPDVVLYQENLDSDLLDEAVAYIRQADVLIVAGTSLTVQPAAGLIRFYQGEKLILINKSPTPLDRLARYTISDSVGSVLRQLAEE